MLYSAGRLRGFVSHAEEQAVVVFREFMLFHILEFLNDILWEYINFVIILLVGLYFTVASHLFQVRTLVHPVKVFQALLHTTSHEEKKGVTPLRLYFTSMGGSVGIGNIGGVVTAVSVGGPGGLFWMWIAVLIGMLVKYAEIYLGIKYRRTNSEGGYDGGAMYYLEKAFPWKGVSVLFCILICIYGTEIYQFKVVEDVLVETFHFPFFAVMTVLLAGTLYVVLGGVNRLAKVCSVLMPFFLVLYTGVCLYVIAQCHTEWRNLLSEVIRSAFTGHAAVGGFAGSTFLVAVKQGMSNAVYSGDIGMGYDSVIQSETQLTHPAVQARTAIFALFTDCMICTLTVLLVLCTGEWCSGCHHGFNCVVSALGKHVPHVRELMAVLFFLAGWTTVLGFMSVGMKSAKALSPQRGGPIYTAYAVSAFIFFSFMDQNRARLVMYVAGGLLMLINLIGIFRLREAIEFPKNVS